MEINIWGIIMSLIGLYLLISGITKSNFIVYRLFVARSKVLWKSEEKVHRFYQVVGVLIIIFGILVALEIIKK
jgi:uncharacterized membrane protein HdeD (DUF308 family)